MGALTSFSVPHPRAIINAGGLIGLVANVAALTAGPAVAGMMVHTWAYGATANVGGGLYRCKTAAQAASDGDIIDELVNHTGQNGRVWVLQYDGAPRASQIGMVTGSDNSAIINSYKANFTALELDDFYEAVGLTFTQPFTLFAKARRGGLTSFDGSAALITDSTDDTARGVKLQSLVLRGVKASDDTVATDIGLSLTSYKAFNLKVDDCEIVGFAHTGINAAISGASKYPGTISNCDIHDNGIGINTGDGEYLNINGNNICENGWNNAHTNSSPQFAGGGWGVIGKHANTQIINNIINNNVVGMALNSDGGNNPDHNKISGNTINHNAIAGLVLANFKNHEVVTNNTILSNVLPAGADASMSYGPLAAGETVDLALSDVYRLHFGFNTVGGGSVGYVLIEGHGRCIYTNNVFLVPPTETRAPNAGSYLYDTAGYTYNGDNLFENNDFAGAPPVILAGSQRTQIIDNLENGLLVDRVPVDPAFTSGWQHSGSAQPCRYWREGRYQVTISGAFENNSTGGATAFTLPVGYRPLSRMRVIALGDTGLITFYVTINTDGTVVPSGYTNNVPFHINATFQVA